MEQAVLEKRSLIKRERREGEFLVEEINAALVIDGIFGTT